jgi:hypothetical protein
MHAVAIRFRSLAVLDHYDAVVAHLEHVLGDRLTDAVAGALVQVNFDAHGFSVTLSQKFVKLW